MKVKPMTDKLDLPASEGSIKRKKRITYIDKAKGLDVALKSDKR